MARKPKTIVDSKKKPSKKKTVTVVAVDDSILANTDLRYDAASMSNVEVRFVGHDIVEPVIKQASRVKKSTEVELTPKITLVEHPELSEPEQSKSDWSFYAVLITIAAFFYAIGVATATLWGI